MRNVVPRITIGGTPVAEIGSVELLKRKDGGSLPVSEQLDPLHGEKYCLLHLEDDGRITVRSGVLKKPTVIEGFARCNEGHNHLVPDEDCKCGFYAFKYTNGEDTEYDGNLAKALVDVELFGRVVEATKGFRGQYQRILRISYQPFCFHCGDDAVFLTSDPNQRIKEDAVTWERTQPSGRPIMAGLLRPSCREAATHQSMTLADVSNLVGTEVRWAEE